MRTSRPGTPQIIAIAVLVVAVQVARPASAHAANPLFAVKATGSQVVPATVSTGTTDVRVTLIGTSLIFIAGSFAGLGGACTAAHIHLGAPGANGPIVPTGAGMMVCTASTSGSVSVVFTPTAGDLANLRNGLWYIDLHTAGFPDGEIRGQAVPLAAHVANLTGAQVVPTPTGDAATGSAEVTLNPAGTHLQVTVGYQGLTGGNTGIDLHGEALPGANAPIIATMVASHVNPNITFLGITVPVTPTQVTQFKSGKMYISVRSAAFPGGAIRGQLKPPDKPFDFDADGAAEVAVFRPGTGVWYIVNQHTGAVRTQAWGANFDRPVAADYDGDGKTDLAIWRSGVFWVNPSATGGVLVQPWGSSGTDLALAPGDFDGDGRTDPAIYRRGATSGNPSFYYILQSVNSAPRILNWGLSGDVDISADYDGDRKTDVSIYRVSTSTYYILGSTDGLIARTWGFFSTDYLSPGDYDGDGKVDIAVFRFNGPGAGTWYVLKSSTQTLEATAFGALGDIPVPGDYDGDGKTDKAVVRSAGGGWTWYILRSSTGTMDVRPFGFTSDFPIPVAIIR